MELSNSDVEASSVSLERLPPAMRVEVGSDSSSRRMIVLRKTAIALLAVASVGLAVPTMALARGGGGLLFEFCLEPLQRHRSL